MRGANKRLENIGEIPSFDDYCNNDMNKHHITDEELREKEYELLSTIFLTRDEAKLLEQYGGDNQSSRKRGAQDVLPFQLQACNEQEGDGRLIKRRSWTTSTMS